MTEKHYCIGRVIMKTITRRSFICAAVLGSSAFLTSCSNVSSSGASASASTSTSAVASASTPEPAAEKIAVVCFSCTGNTERIARVVAQHLSADYMQIEPAEPYTAEDLDYNSDCRANREQNDETARPALENPVDVSAYGSVILAHPIWWGTAPRIINTFIEANDFTGKNVAQFVTSGGSGVNQAENDIRGLMGQDVVWKSAIRFASDTSDQAINEWAGSVVK